MKPPFTSSQEMYNYAANQMINQNLSNDQVKNNLMERGVTDADAETVIQNMLVAIEKQNKPSAATTSKTSYASTASQHVSAPAANEWGSFASSHEMYNYAANKLIVDKLNQQTVKQQLLNKGVSDAQADVVIKNMLEQIQKDKPAQVNAKRAEGRKMMLVGVILVVLGAILQGVNFTIAGETFAITYGIMALGAILFFKGLFKMF
jgi:SOS response regulatory protein OraA/RecX